MLCPWVYPQAGLFIPSSTPLTPPRMNSQCVCQTLHVTSKPLHKPSTPIRQSVPAHADMRQLTLSSPVIKRLGEDSRPLPGLWGPYTLALIRVPTFPYKHPYQRARFLLGTDPPRTEPGGLPRPCELMVISARLQHHTGTGMVSPFQNEGVGLGLSGPGRQSGYRGAKQEQTPK